MVVVGAALRRRGRKASVTASAPTQFVSRTSRKAARGEGFWENIPALLTRISMRPKVSRTCLAAASMEVSDVTSISRGETVPLVSGKLSSVLEAAVPLDISREPSRMW